MSLKNLYFQKTYYEDLIKKVSEAQANSEDVKAYGLYYYAFIGLIRSGCLIRRLQDRDGIPILSIYSGDKEYHCREDTIKDLLGTDYNGLITPYEDEMNSWYFVTEYKEEKIVDVEPSEKGTFLSGFKTGKTKKDNNDDAKMDAEEEYIPDYDKYYDEDLPILIAKAENIDTDFAPLNIFFGITAAIGIGICCILL